MKDKALVLLSGGLDSTVCLSIAVNDFEASNVITLSLLYGQKHDREVEAARTIADHFGCKHKVFNLPNLFQGYGSTLMDPDEQDLEMSYEDIRNSSSISPAYVPFRNGNLLSASATLALVEDANHIYYGAHAEDARSFFYPDCTPEFNGAMANAIYVGTYHKVRLITPLQWLNKKDIVQMANRLNAPIHLTYSCYAGREQHCGKCPACVSRVAGFQQAGLKDPVKYEIAIDWED